MSSGLVNKYQNKTGMQYGPLVAPKELNSMIKPTAAPAGRNPSYTPADTRMPVTESNPLIEIKLPNTLNQWNDFYRGGIFVKLSLSRTGGTYIRPSNLICNMIERFELIDGNTQVEDYQYFGEKYTLNYFLNKERNAGDTSGFTYYGEASTAERASRHTTTTSFEYKIPITSDVLCNKHAFPNFEPFAKGTDQLIMRWYIAKASKWIETDAPTYSWTITQWDMYKDNVDVMDPMKYIKMLQSSDFAGTIKYSWVNDDVMFRNLETTTSQTVLIEQKKSSIHGFLVTVRKSSDINNPAANDKFETWYGPQHKDSLGVLTNTFPLISYQWRLDSKPWPERPVRTTGPYALEAYRWLSLWKNHDNGEGNLDETFDISGPQFASDKFIMVLDARVWPQLGQVYNHFTTLKSNNALQLQLEFSTPPPAGLQLVIHTIHDKDWYFGYAGGGKVVW